MITDWPDKIIAVCNASPLVIGIGDGENIIAFDSSAIIDKTRNVIYMQDNEVAVITKNNIKFFNDSDISKRVEKLEWSIDNAQKNSYPHFMFKEIFERPETILTVFAAS